MISLESFAFSKALMPERLSASVREELVGQISNLSSCDAAAIWAANALAAKNSLTDVDAKLVEDAFEQQLSGFASTEAKRSIDAGPTDVSAVPSSSSKAEMK